MVLMIIRQSNRRTDSHILIGGTQLPIISQIERGDRIHIRQVQRYPIVIACARQLNKEACHRKSFSALSLIRLMARSYSSRLAQAKSFSARPSHPFLGEVVQSTGASIGQRAEGVK